MYLPRIQVGISCGARTWANNRVSSLNTYVTVSWSILDGLGNRSRPCGVALTSPRPSQLRCLRTRTRLIWKFTAFLIVQRFVHAMSHVSVIQATEVLLPKRIFFEQVYCNQPNGNRSLAGLSVDGHLQEVSNIPDTHYRQKRPRNCFSPPPSSPITTPGFV